MSKTRTERSSRSARPAKWRPVTAMELVGSWLGRYRQDDPAVEYEKLRRARIALFGCAPK